MNITKLTAIVLALALLLSCNNGGEMKQITASTSPSINDISASTWEKLSQKKIYFGHQSIGDNIIDGIKDMMSEHPEIKLNVIEISDPDDFKRGIFAHSKIGKNMDPESKIDAFTEIMENGVAEKVDIAILKFCAVDINPPTDVEKVFNKYIASLSKLKVKYPNTEFVHVTVPLT